jgi:hypothetical protein
VKWLGASTIARTDVSARSHQQVDHLWFISCGRDMKCGVATKEVVLDLG